MGRMVSRALPAALSHVLGRALSLSGFSVRRASRTGGQPHYPEPARSPLHRYSDELHVPQRSVVVFLNADSVLFDLSPALLRSSPARTMGLFVDRMRRRIFCALFFARGLAAKWIVGPRWFRDLSIAGARSRHVVSDVAQSIDCARGMVFTPRRRLRGRINPLSPGIATLSRPLQLHFRRFRHGRMLLPRNRWRRRNPFVVQRTCETVRSCRRLLLRPLPHSSALCHLAGASHPPATDLDVSVNRRR